MGNFRALEMKSLAWVYGVLVFVCLLADLIYRGNPLAAWTQSHLPSFLFVVIGISLILLNIVASWLMVHFFRWGVELESILRQILTPLSFLQILLLASISGLVEEWFFRGILQNHFGIIMSSLLFGLAHLLPTPRVWIWSLWCFVVGIIFGVIYKASGSLLLVAMIHAGINAIQLMKLNWSPEEKHHLPSGF